MAQKPKPPRMTPYANRRPRKYLHETEVLCMMAAAREVGRNGHRDATLIWTMYRHGLRVSEARSLNWGQIDFEHRRIHVTRSKNGLDTTQLLAPHELGALTILKSKDAGQHDPVFLSERHGALGRSAIYKIIARAGAKAEIGFQVNPHALRHSCGFHLTNVRRIDTRRVQEYLGHRDIKHTVIYTELDGNKFNDIWGDETDTP